MIEGLLKKVGRKEGGKFERALARLWTLVGFGATPRPFQQSSSRRANAQRGLSTFLPPPYFIIILFSLLSLRAEARTTSFDVLNFTPVTDGSHYFTIYDSETLTHLDTHAAFHLDYALKPLQRSGGAPGTREGIVEHIVVGTLGGAIGLWDWFQAGLNFPVVLHERFYDPNQASPPGEDKNRLGDLGLHFKLNLVNLDEFPVGLGLVPFLTFPTGSGAVFTGSNRVTGGAKLVIDGKALRRITWAVNLGYLFRESMTLRNVEQDDNFLLQGGANIRIVDWLHTITELDMRTVFSNFFQDQTQSPVELRAGLRFSPSEWKGFVLNLGLGGGLANGIGAPDFRAFTGVFYQPSYGKPRYDTPRTVVEIREVILQRDRILILRNIYFEFDKTRILTRSYSILDQVAQVLKDNPHIELIRVEGHTDSKGADDYNLKLSQGRAESVVDYLVEKGGVERKRLMAQGFGESQPMVPNEVSEEDRAQNRRVEFIILKQKEIRK